MYSRMISLKISITTSITNIKIKINPLVKTRGFCFSPSSLTHIPIPSLLLHPSAEQKFDYMQQGEQKFEKKKKKVEQKFDRKKEKKDEKKDEEREEGRMINEKYLYVS